MIPFAFDGSTHISTADVPFDFAVSDSFSSGGWVFPTDSSDGGRFILDKRSGNGWGLFNFGPLGVEFFMIGNTFVEIRTTTALTINQWTHVFFTYDGSGTASGVKIYFDGVEQPTTTIGTFPTSGIKNGADLLIGSRFSGTQKMLGQLDDIGIFDFALSSSQVASLI